MEPWHFSISCSRKAKIPVFLLVSSWLPHAQACDLSSSSKSATAYYCSNRLASFHESFVRLNEEIKSYFDKSGAMRLNILVLLMADLLVALRYIVVEISSLLFLLLLLFFLLEPKAVSRV